jgi:hypothetical protein
MRVLVRKASKDLLWVITDRRDTHPILLQHHSGLFQLHELGAAVLSPIGATVKHQKQAVWSSEVI